MSLQNDRPEGFAARIAERLHGLGPAERRVAQYFSENREETLVASAIEIARKTGTSDATVVRATKALGYAGMDELRRALLDELRANLAPAARLARTLGEAGDSLEGALESTLETHRNALDALRRDITPSIFGDTVRHIAAAKRVFIFGIGPSSAMAEYFSIQLGRFGIDSASLTHTGLLLADGLHRLRPGDFLVILAYSRVYREIESLLARAGELSIPVALMTDTLGPALAKRVSIVLPVARGRADMLSLHTATLGLIEALLVGVASHCPTETIGHLKTLNALRTKLVDRSMVLPAPTNGGEASAPDPRGRRRR